MWAFIVCRKWHWYPSLLLSNSWSCLFGYKFCSVLLNHFRIRWPFFNSLWTLKLFMEFRFRITALCVGTAHSNCSDLNLVKCLFCPVFLPFFTLRNLEFFFNLLKHIYEVEPSILFKGVINHTIWDKLTIFVNFFVRIKMG